jgi:glycosyltransferase involved in cell wall biosynthesis
VEQAVINLKIIVAGGPAENYVDKCLESIYSQTYKNWVCQVVLDPVGDNTYNKAVKHQSDKMKVQLNTTRQYPAGNLLEASKLLDPADDDVLIMIDADDWLATPESFSIVVSKYEKNSKLLLTYGTWESYPRADVYKKLNFPYSLEDFKIGVRKVTWRASHLRTCKYKLWKHIKNKDLRDTSGKYFTVAGDLALMFPMLEMAGCDRTEFIPEVLYTYNMETPFNEYKTRAVDQINADQYIRSLQSYEVLGEI